jgi:membrane protein
MKFSTAVTLGWDAIQGLSKRNGVEFSGYIAFTIMLSLFPFLIFLVSVAGFFGQTRTGEEVISTMSLFAPPDVINTLQPALQQVIQKRSGGLLTFGLLFALYSAASGVAALRIALNLTYGANETRSFLSRKLQDFFIVIVGSVVVILASAAIILGPFLWKMLAWFTFVSSDDRSAWHVARYGFTLIILATSVVSLHRVLPDTRLQWKEILPGALTTTILWVIAASVLTLYFGRYANYASTYGSLGGVIITLMFFYISAIIFIFGGELNAVLLAREKAPGAPQHRELRPSSPHSA